MRIPLAIATAVVLLVGAVVVGVSLLRPAAGGSGELRPITVQAPQVLQPPTTTGTPVPSTPASPDPGGIVVPPPPLDGDDGENGGGGDGGDDDLDDDRDDDDDRGGDDDD